MAVAVMRGAAPESCLQLALKTSAGGRNGCTAAMPALACHTAVAPPAAAGPAPLCTYFACRGVAPGPAALSCTCIAGLQAGLSCTFATFTRP